MVLLLMLFGCVLQDDPVIVDGINYTEIAAKVEENNKNRVKQLPDTIKNIKRSITKARRARVQPAKKRENITKLEESIEQAKSDAEAYKTFEKFALGRLEIPLVVGSFGTLERCHIKQVTGIDSMLCDIGYTQQKPLKSFSKDVIIYKYDTDGLTDGSGFNDKDAVFVVVGTETYSTVTGATRTVSKLQPVDLKLLRKVLKGEELKDSN